MNPQQIRIVAKNGVVELDIPGSSPVCKEQMDNLTHQLKGFIAETEHTRVAPEKHENEEINA